ncbi:MAG: hypothetical protein K0U43_01610, partial [Gammaproteobacteria bacterium]|nr:hypothetical protein [Gammaproteobacteria bacterium]
MALFRRQTLSLLRTSLFVVYAQFMVVSSAYAQQLPGTENGEWRYLGGDAGNTRFSALDQINESNFAELEQAW